MSIKVYICDDDSLIRESLSLLLPLKRDIIIVGQGTNGMEAIEFCTKNEVDVALLDIRMPELNGVLATKEITSNSKTKCLILTTFNEDEYIEEALSYGAKGYILKNSSPKQIVNSIISVYNNTIVMNEIILEKIYKRKPEINKHEFTTRELEIILAISEGLSNKEISNKLFISEGTVRNYITMILDKTNLNHRTAIAVNFLKGNL